jgi:hypothetical protein
MKRIWRWLMETIKRLFGIRKKEPGGIDLNEERFRSPKLFKSIVKIFRGQWGRGGPNMPRKQRCPECRRLSKRERKTVAGAFYSCNRCKMTFLVVNRAAARDNPGKAAAGAL